MSLVLNNNIQYEKNAWQPIATPLTLKIRAEILAKIRSFFAQRNILEVETPLMCRSAATDPFLEALSLAYQKETFYLQTSPEYAMKRLLCAGLGDIYQISKAFRSDESGRLHNPEFTLLEWYRINFDHQDFINEIECFLKTVIQAKSAQKISYKNLFEQYLNFDPHKISEKSLKIILQKNNIVISDHNNLLTKTDGLNLLMTHVIEPELARLDRLQPVIIYDFPIEQAALAKIKDNIAQRFEVYLQGIELANGYHELTDAKEQQKRFEKDLIRRKALNYADNLPIDQSLIAALEHGLPGCAGAALGVDRLIMTALNKTHISEVMAFDYSRV